MTTSPRYPWTRWWLPVGIEPLLTSGFLDDPAGPYAAYLDDRPVRLADCDETSCVVLFGDAGMGKSTELEDDRARHRTAGTPSVLLDLGEDETWTDVRNRLLSHPDVVAWQAAAGGKLVILVDSVDEATTSMRKLTDHLLRLLDDLPHDEAYGDNGKLRDWLEVASIAYVVAVACDTRVPAGAGRTIRADALAAKVPARGWHRMSCGPGSKGERLYDWALADADVSGNGD